MSGVRAEFPRELTLTPKLYTDILNKAGIKFRGNVRGNIYKTSLEKPYAVKKVFQRIIQAGVQSRL